jgi:hypothetical protein
MDLVKDVGLDEYITTSEQEYTPGKSDRMLIISRPGAGKTEALMQLPNSIMFDLENSSGHFKGKSEIVNVRKIAAKKDWGPVSTIKQVTSAIKASGKRYRFCIVDTISVLDDWAESLALFNFKQTTIGKNFKGKSVFELEYGGGYLYHREAFKEIIECFEGIAETLILVAHVKDASLKKGSDSIAALDIRLTGSLREIISSSQDASGVLTFDRKEPKTRYLDFRKTDENIFMKCRPAHLAGKLVKISEQDESGILHTSWENVFIDLKN